MLRTVALPRKEGEPLHLLLEVVENGRVTLVARVVGENTEAVMRSGRLLRIVGHMVHGEEIEASILMPDKDDNHGVIPGTRTIRE